MLVIWSWIIPRAWTAWRAAMYFCIVVELSGVLNAETKLLKVVGAKLTPGLMVLALAFFDVGKGNTVAAYRYFDIERIEQVSVGDLERAECVTHSC
jgi:hypothetical protein